MHLLIISCTPRTRSLSNTDKILDKFKNGFELDGNTAKILYLSKRNEWDNIRTKFYENYNILLALPLYIECIPGIMLEFLETLKPKSDNKITKISFLLQGGFAEASQLRCCEKYLENLPKYLNCRYNGTLLKGDMFAVSLLDEKSRNKLIDPFIYMGTYFAKTGYFDKKEVDNFAKSEYFSKKLIFFYTLVRPIQKVFISLFAKNMGCKTSLKYQPYKEYIIKNNK